MDIRLSLMTGVDIPVEECKIILHQPKIKEISFIGEEDFFKGYQTLCINKSMFVEGKNDLGEINNFQIFMTVIGDKQSADKKEAVKKIFTILFPNYNVMISPRSLIFQSQEGTLTVDESNFEFLQNMLKLVFCAKEGPMDQQAFNPGDAKAKEIAEKLMRGRERVAELKGENNVSVFSQYLSILTIALHIPLSNLIELTMFQLYDLIERYSLYINWDLDIRTRLAGGSPDSQPENWMKNIH